MKALIIIQLFQKVQLL